MRTLLITLGLAAALLTGCATAPPVKPVASVKQVDPISEIVIIQCNEFKGAALILPDGTVRALMDKAAARAVYDALPDGHAMVADLEADCAPKQST